MAAPKQSPRTRGKGGVRARSHSTNPAVEAELAERTKQVVSLRMAGASWTQIAERVGYAQPAGAYKAWQRALADVPRTVVEEARRTEEARLDTMLAAVWPAVLRGQLGAVDRAIAISRRRARMLGLDAPLKITGTLTDSLSEEVERLARAMRELDPDGKALAEANEREA